MTEIDRAVFAAYCVEYSRWVAAVDQLAQTTLLVKTANDNFMQNPYLAIANKAEARMATLAAEFGMTPSARSKVTAGERPAEDDAFGAWESHGRRSAS